MNRIQFNTISWIFQYFLPYYNVLFAKKLINCTETVLPLESEFYDFQINLTVASSFFCYNRCVLFRPLKDKPTFSSESLMPGEN